MASTFLIVLEPSSQRPPSIQRRHMQPFETIASQETDRPVPKIRLALIALRTIFRNLYPLRAIVLIQILRTFRLKAMLDDPIKRVPPTDHWNNATGKTVTTSSISL